MFTGFNIGFPGTRDELLIPLNKLQNSQKGINRIAIKFFIHLSVQVREKIFNAFKRAVEPVLM